MATLHAWQAKNAQVSFGIAADHFSIVVLGYIRDLNDAEISVILDDGDLGIELEGAEFSVPEHGVVFIRRAGTVCIVTEAGRANTRVN